MLISPLSQVILPPMLSMVLWFSPGMSPTLHLAANTDSPSSSLDILEVIKVYGKLAGPTCYGRVAPKGSSCQITSSELKQTLFPKESSNSAVDSISRNDLAQRLAQANFQWPLKPYGIEKSNDKTALMNKGAETRLYMEELQAAGLYDARNPAGPLPTSLRPQLNALLQRQGLEEGTIDRLNDVLRRGSGEITEAKIDELMAGKDGAMDYYDFIQLLGRDKVLWR